MVLSDPTLRGAEPTVLVATPVGALGGVARHLLDLARVGVPGHRLVFLTPDGPLAGALSAAGAAVLTGRFGPDAGLRASVGTLRGVVTRLRPAIIHTHLSYADVVAPLASAGLPVRLVTTEHGIAADDLVYHGSAAKAALMARVHQTRLRAFRAIVAVSEATAAAMRSKWHPATPIVVIPNGVDAPATPPTPHAGLRVVSIARLSPEKRIDQLLRALALVVADRPEAGLAIAGEGPLRDSLEALTGELGLTDHVRLLGFRDAAEVMAEADVLAQLSVWENCSYSLLDAVSHGLGVCASDVGGNPEILPAHCLVNADDPGQVARVLIDQGTALGERPRLGPEWPTTLGMAQRLAEVYQGVLR